MIRDKKIAHNLVPLFKKLRKVLEAEREIIFTYLFGSYGKGTPHALSDVDIAIYLKPGIRDSFKKKMELQEVTSKVLLTDEIDIVILNEAPLSLIIEILNSKKILFSKDEDIRIEFEIKNMKEYMDTEKLRKLSTESLIKRIKEGKYGYPPVY